MDKETILSKYKRPEEKLMLSKFFDKAESVEVTGKIAVTDFYNETEKKIISKVINLAEIENALVYGGCENADRNLVIIYPEKMRELFTGNNFKFDTIFSVIRINVPKENRTFFNHSVYLGGIVKLGIKREKVGDIVTYEEGADIIVKKEVEKFLYTNITMLTRFSNCKVEIISTNDITKKEQTFKNIEVITSSLRLDNIIAELAKTSRNNASKILAEERVFVNYECETKPTKSIKENDVVTIRGKGKFIISKMIGNTKKGNYILEIKKYV